MVMSTLPGVTGTIGQSVHSHVNNKVNRTGRLFRTHPTAGPLRNTRVCTAHALLGQQMYWQHDIAEQDKLMLGGTCGQTFGFTRVYVWAGKCKTMLHCINFSYCIFPHSWLVLLCKSAAKTHSRSLRIAAEHQHGEWKLSGCWSEGSSGHSPEPLMKVSEGLYSQTGDISMEVALHAMAIKGWVLCEPEQWTVWGQCVTRSLNSLWIQLLVGSNHHMQLKHRRHLCPASASQHKQTRRASAPRKTSLACKASGRICESFWIRLCLWAAWNPLSNQGTSAIL